MTERKRILTWRRSVVAACALLAAAQFGRCDMSNPPVDRAEAVEQSPLVSRDVAELLARSCKDCHSNETRWPAYSTMAPLSWVIWYDVDRARRMFNLSTWTRYSPSRARVWLGSVCDAVQTGRMPLPRYVWMHPDAALDEHDRRMLCDWAEAVDMTSGQH
ncbi:MAG TPA: heme-binding domain-containing protein [Vicinamibacterales bacterium]|nr:heme-binding domain-containing protein [Vicinamibacterales bacterium]